MPTLEIDEHPPTTTAAVYNAVRTPRMVDDPTIATSNRVAPKKENSADGMNGAKSTNEDKEKTEIVPLSQLFKYADGTDKLLMLVGTLSAFATGVSQPLQIILFGDILNAFNSDPNTNFGDQVSENINSVALKFVWVGIAVIVCGFGQVTCWSITACRQAKRLKYEYIRAILRQEIGWFDVNEPMTLATKVADTSLIIQDGMGRKIGDGANFFAMGVAGITIGIVKGWELALCLLAFTPLIAFTAFLMVKTLSSAIKAGVEAYGSAGGVAEEALSNIRTVQMFNAMKKFSDKYAIALQSTEIAGIKKGLAIGCGTGAMFFTIFCTYSFGMYYGAVKIANDNLGPTPCVGDSCYNGGRVLTVFFSIIMGAMALGQAGPSVQAVYSARAAAHTVFKLIDRESKVNPFSTEGKELDNVQGDIGIEQVRFRYPSRAEVEVCSGYTLKIPAGQKVALVGPSGSGKSTIVSLLERFYDPESGAVKLDGHDLKTLNVKWLRQQIGLVGQEPALFSMSIGDNIANGKLGVSIEEIHAAAKQANAYDFIMSFPNGFDTEVGERGAQLSGGQKQRIAIARAIIKNPAVLLLDEATSALDTESERIVQESLDALLATRKRTTIIIAHRLSTIRDADRIVVLDKGNVVEEGSHDQLMQLPNGQYKLLVEAQNRTQDQSRNSVQSLKEVVDEKRDRTASHLSDVPGLIDRDMNSKSKYEVSKEGGADENEMVPKVSLWRVWGLSRPNVGYCILGSVGAMVNGATFPVWGVLLTKVTVLFFNNSLTQQEMKDRGSNWGIAFLILGVVFASSIVLQNFGFAVVSERLTTRLRQMGFDAMMRQDIGWFDMDSHSSGALTTRLATDTAIIQSMTLETLNRTLVNLATLGVAFGIAFYYSWAMTLALLGVFPILGFASYIQMSMMSGHGKKTNEGDTKAGALLSESINSIRTVASFTMEEKRNETYLSLVSQSSATDTKSGIGGGAGFGVSQGVMFFALAFLFWFGGYLVTHGKINFEAMFMVMMAVMLSSFGVGMAAQNMSDSAKAKKAAASLFETVDRVPPIDNASTAGDKIEHVQGKIELKNIFFNYPSRPESKIYKNYSLKIESGMTVALVGASGSGKSTAISLIERFYDPLQGGVYLDGKDIRTLNVTWLREHISLVGQEPVLFAGTIADNITTGKRGATLDDVIDAAKKANAHDFIMQFPDGYETQVGDRGAQVSGGQKQRIAIARAILRDPEVLLLDEATSALDNESERIVQESLDALLKLKKRTTIVVAHRLSTIRNADLIAVASDGQIVEQGTHDALMRKDNSIYKTLVARQLNSGH